jgi:undecaprenyl-diphosphatase
MIDTLLYLDQWLLLKINGLNTPWLDSMMSALTQGIYWLPLFILVIGSIIYRAHWKTISILLLLAVVIFLTDRISAGLLKPWIGRLRPSHNPELESLLHFVNNYKGGLYGFVSSHATNAFGIATFLWLILRKSINWIWIMYLWAIIFSFTRIYLGVHYPSDILGGAVLGSILGLGVYKISRLMPEKISPLPS